MSLYRFICRLFSVLISLLFVLYFLDLNIPESKRPAIMSLEEDEVEASVEPAQCGEICTD